MPEEERDRIGNPFGPGIRTVFRQLRTLEWDAPFFNHAVTSLVLLGVLGVLIVLYPTIGVCMQLANTFAALIGRTIQELQHCQTAERVGHVVAIGVYGLFLLFFGMIASPFYILGVLFNVRRSASDPEASRKPGSDFPSQYLIDRGTLPEQMAREMSSRFPEILVCGFGMVLVLPNPSLGQSTRTFSFCVLLLMLYLVIAFLQLGFSDYWTRTKEVSGANYHRRMWIFDLLRSLLIALVFGLIFQELTNGQNTSSVAHS